MHLQLEGEPNSCTSFEICHVFLCRSAGLQWHQAILLGACQPQRPRLSQSKAVWLLGASAAHLTEILLRLLQVRGDQLRHVRRRRWRRGRHCRRRRRNGRELVVAHDGSRFLRGCLGPAHVVPVVGRAGGQSASPVRQLDLRISRVVYYTHTQEHTHNVVSHQRSTPNYTL